MTPTVYDRMVRPGDPWQERMTQAISQAQFVFVVWSKDAAASAQLAREIQAALHAPAARVVPVLIDGTPLPSDLAPLQGVDWR